MPADRRHRDNVPAARNLRQSLTASERLLWEQLRDRRFRGLKFRRQHPVGPFVLDFFCSELKLAIEVDGGVHLRAAEVRRDRERQRILEEMGIQFVRLRTEAVEADVAAALQLIVAALPHPQPLSLGERGTRTVPVRKTSRG